MIQVQLIGVRQVNRFIRNLPKELDKEINDESGQFMKDVRKSAKLRAPKDTRELSRSIILTKKGKQWILSVESPYGRYQEEGFRPHWIHTDMITGSNKFSQLYGEKRGFIFVSKSTPFVKPALEKNLSKLAQKMSNATKRAIRKNK